MLIRWAPAAVHLVAYYANLMLISSFLGLGLGAMAGTRRRDVFELFPVLLLGEVLFLAFFPRVVLPGSESELRFFSAAAPRALNYAALIALFLVNAAVFAPLGQRIGGLLGELPRLRAYSCDLAGSLAGTVVFGLFSFYRFSPILGMGAVLGLLVFLGAPRARWRWGFLGAAILAVMAASRDPAAIWSPYYYITIQDTNPQGGAVRADPGAFLGRLFYAEEKGVSAPRESILTMRNPPIYSVHVNHDFYQPHQTIDPARYDDPVLKKVVERALSQYLLPYSLVRGRERVLVLGAGGGTDAQAALLAGARRVDAVEIDPVLVGLSRRFNASGVYDDPRVSVHVDDARAFLRRAAPGYDLVVFGWLDSQALFSQMSNIRLDGYVYTVESLRSAYALVGENGMLAVSFMAAQEWLADKIVRLVRDAVGRMPVIYERDGRIVLCVPRGEHAPPPAHFGEFRRVRPEMPLDDVEPPSDDWPYLYLRGRGVPRDYLIVIGALAAASLAALLLLRGGGFDAADAHFFFLGFGFLLLETGRIVDCSLFFGATWLVTMLVVAGVLLMALLANFAAARVKSFSPFLYMPLFAALLLLHLMPRESVLAWPWAGRVLWTATAVSSPFFFAGLIFSLTFRAAEAPAARFGANLLGAMLGGFCEYLGMAVGHHRLEWIVFAAYALSLVCLLRARKLRAIIC